MDTTTDKAGAHHVDEARLDEMDAEIQAGLDAVTNAANEALRTLAKIGHELGMERPAPWAGRMMLGHLAGAVGELGNRSLSICAVEMTEAADL